MKYINRLIAAIFNRDLPAPACQCPRITPASEKKNLMEIGRQLRAFYKPKVDALKIGESITFYPPTSIDRNTLQKSISHYGTKAARSRLKTTLNSDGSMTVIKAPHIRKQA